MRLLRSIYDWMDDRLNGWIVLLLLLLFLPFPLYLLPEMESHLRLFAGGSVDLLGLKFGFTPEEAYQSLDSLGEAGRREYQRALLLTDTPFALVNALFLSSLLILLFRKVLNPGSPWQLFALLPWLNMLLDWLENGGSIGLSAQFPDLSPVWVHMTSAVSALKWLVAGSTLFIVVAALVAYAIELWKQWLPH